MKSIYVLVIIFLIFPSVVFASAPVVYRNIHEMEVGDRIIQSYTDYRFVYFWIGDSIYLYEGRKLRRIGGLDGRIEKVSNYGKYISIFTGECIEVLSYDKVVRKRRIVEISPYMVRVIDGFLLKKGS